MMSIATKIRLYVWLLAAIGSLGVLLYAAWVYYIADRNEQAVSIVTTNTQQITGYLYSAVGDAQTFRDMLTNAIAMGDEATLAEARAAAERVNQSLGLAAMAETALSHAQEMDSLQTEFNALYPSLMALASTLIQDPNLAMDMADSLQTSNTRYDRLLARIRATTHEHLQQDAQSLAHISKNMKSARHTGILAALMSLGLIVLVAAYLSRLAVQVIRQGEQLSACVLMVTAEKEAAQQEALANKEAALQTIRSYSEKLEEQVKQRTEALETALVQKADYLTKVEALLNNAGEGFLSFGEDLMIDEGYSRECLSLFGCERLSGKVTHWLAPESPSQQAFLEKAFRAIMATAMDSDVEHTMVSLLPEKIRLGDKQCHVSYRRTAPHSLMLVIDDVTEKLALEKALSAKHEEFEFIVYALSHREEVIGIFRDFKLFVSTEATRLLAAGAVKPTPLDEIYRHIHTFKSLLAQASCPELPQKLHALESALSELRLSSSPFDDARWQDMLDSYGIVQAVQSAEGLLRHHLGDVWQTSDLEYRIPRSLVDALEAAALTVYGPSSSEVLQLKSLKYKPLRQLLEPHFKEAMRLALACGKPLEAVVYEGDNPLMDPVPYQEFLRACVHVFKNAIDHGIETPAQRAAFGKAPAGTLRCQVTVSPLQLDIIVEDDGAGIDTQRLRAKTVSLGLMTEQAVQALSEQEACDLVFLDGLSSRETATQTAGRGVGLAAVRAAVAALGGQVTVHSRWSEGTRWHIQLPWRIA